MSAVDCRPVVLPPRTVALRRRLSPPAAFYLLASITATFLAGSLAPTPLYPIYQAEWGFSALTVTAIFSIYALALLASLLIAGRLSDHVGRRPVLIVAAIAQAATMMLFIEANGSDGLLLARLVQGLVTGAALGAVGAGLIDLDKNLGPVANAVAPMTGTASGGVASGLMVHFLPAPTSLIYLTLAAVFLLQAVGVALMDETVPLRAGGLASLAPQFRLPTSARRPMALAAPVLVAAWSLAGFYASLGPAVMRSVFGVDASLGGGGVAFALAGSGAVTVYLLRSWEPRSVMIYSSLALLLGVTLSVVGLAAHSTVGFVGGAAIAGTGFGAGFQGTVRTVASNAWPHERSGVLSVIFVVAYIAMGIPSVVAGFFIAQFGNLLLTAESFGVAVALLATLSLLGALLPRSQG